MAERRGLDGGAGGQVTGGQHVAVLGAGSWGTALAQHLDRVGHSVTLWGRDEAVLQAIETTHINPRYFPNLKLSESIAVERDLLLAVKGKPLVVFSVPSRAMESVATAAAAALGQETLLVSTAKGLADNSLQSMSEVLERAVGLGAAVKGAAVKEGGSKVAVLSGPSFAREVLEGLPTAVTMAAKQLSVAQEAAAFFHLDSFRVYTSTDVIGVEYGGILKNIIAVAVGVADGLGMGNNARAALITRGLLEMQRLTLALGGEQNTVTGLSGLGDLLLTATGDLSRNRQFGLRLGHGETLEQVMSSMTQVAEGVLVASKAVEVADQHGIAVPIMEEVSRIVSGASTAKDSVRRLLSRAPTAEIR